MGNLTLIKKSKFLRSSVPLAMKILAYKIFFLPILLQSWFKDTSQLEQLEIKTLKQIFGNYDERYLYKMYSGLCLPSFIKLLEIKWKRRTGLSSKYLLKVLNSYPYNTFDSNDYFTLSTKHNFIQAIKRKKE